VVWKPFVVSGCICTACAPGNFSAFGAYCLVAGAGKKYPNVDGMIGVCFPGLVDPWSVVSGAPWRSVSPQALGATVRVVC